jgi:hypothetical protein
LREFSKRSLVSGPVVQSSGIEVGSIRPDQCVGLRINANLIEQPKISQRGVQLTGKNRSKADRLLCTVVKSDSQHVV